MKRSNLLFLIIGVAIIFFGCSKDDPLAPELNQSDQETASLKAAKIKTPFSGYCTLLAVLDLGEDVLLPNGKTQRTGYISQWQDHSDDPLIAGVSTWYMNWMIEEDGITAKIRGKADVLLDDGKGKWELSFHAEITKTEVGMMIESVSIGTGKEGEVKGMVAKWVHTMNYDFLIPETFVYNFEGYYK